MGWTDLDNLTLLCLSPHPFPAKRLDLRINGDGCRNGYRRGGSTNINDPNSTPASDASTPNANPNIGGDDHPPHEVSE